MLVGAFIFFAIIVMLLAMPVGVRFDIAWHGELEQRVDLIWAFGLVRTRVAPSTEGRASEKEKAGGKPRGRRPPRRQKRKPDVLGALRLRPFRRRLLRFFAALWRAVHKDGVSVDVRIGLGDPADTGRLWALLGPCSGLLRRVPDVAVSLEPEFHDATFELDTKGALRIVPLRVLGIAGALAVSPSLWRGLRVMRGRT